MIGLFDTPGAGGAVREPLAARMRPRSLDEFVGQEQIVGPGRALRRAIESDALPSMILWGPPGTGKTTLAQIIAAQTGAHFAAISAVSAGVADLRRIVAEAAALKRVGRRSVLFIDEIHRFNKAQQDAVLPHVEDGTVTLIGATTENPSFEVNSALLSRSRVFVLTSLDDGAIRTLLVRALGDVERGLGAGGVVITPTALDALVNLANGDAGGPPPDPMTPAFRRSTSRRSPMRCRSVRAGMTRTVMGTTIRSARSSKRFAAAIRMRRSTISRA
jgi:putative ATPase